MQEQVRHHKRKLTIGDAELRDLFACFVSVGLVMARVAQKPDVQVSEKEWSDIAKASYDGAAACIERRKINKERVRAEYARDEEEDSRGNV